MDGYVLIERGVDKCGIADGPPSYPTVSGAPGPAPTPTPTPPPAPTPTPTPTPGTQHHYEAPPCLDDEMLAILRVEASCVPHLAMLLEAALRISPRTCPTLSLSASSRTRTLATSTVPLHAASLEAIALQPRHAPPLLRVSVSILMAPLSMLAP